MTPKRALLGAAAALLLATALPVTAQNRPIEINFWMGLTGQGGELLTRYGEEFNKSQSEYRVIVSFKGQYPEQRAAAVAAFRADISSDKISVRLGLGLAFLSAISV